MRRDGDLLVTHVGRAKNGVLLCSPFIKYGVVKRLLDAIKQDVPVEIVTRWHAEEVAAGVSDLAVFDFTVSRPNVTMRLLDNLHAKLYIADEALLTGSANLTATALGWCADPNLEILLPVSINDEAVVRCRAELSNARLATANERALVQAAVDCLQLRKMPGAQEIEETTAGLWLPKLAAPERLYVAYLPNARDRLTSSAIVAADHDLHALGVEADLSETDFKLRVAEHFSNMAAVKTILDAAHSDLTDTAAAKLVDSLVGSEEMSGRARWLIIREWMTYFLSDRYEIAPQSFVTRLRSGASRQ